VCCCGLVEPEMTFPIKKRIITELFIERKQGFINKKWEPNFLAKLKRVKCWHQDKQEVGIKNHNGSLYKMNYIRRKWKNNHGSLFEMTLNSKATLKHIKVNCEQLQEMSV